MEDQTPQDPGADPAEVQHQLDAEASSQDLGGDGTPAQAIEPTGRLKRPEDTNGVYVVLWAEKPKRGDKSRPAYREATYVKAHNPDAAKRQVMNEKSDLGEYLRHAAAQGGGILLRAAPALNWPDEVEPTTYERPAPVLTVR